MHRAAGRAHREKPYEMTVHVPDLGRREESAAVKSRYVRGAGRTDAEPVLLSESLAARPDPAESAPADRRGVFEAGERIGGR